MLQSLNENLLYDVVKARKALREKFKSIKFGESQIDEQLKKTFYPITEPLKKFLDESQIQKSKHNYDDDHGEGYNDQKKINIKRKKVEKRKKSHCKF